MEGEGQINIQPYNTNSSMQKLPSYNPAYYSSQQQATQPSTHPNYHDLHQYQHPHVQQQQANQPSAPPYEPAYVQQQPMYQPMSAAYVQPTQPTPVNVVVQTMPVTQPTLLRRTQIVGRPTGTRPCVATCALCGQTAPTKVKRKAEVKYWFLCLLLGFTTAIGHCCVPCFDCSYDHYHY
eukprot:131966_1